jgi:hypothetical protein
VIAQTRCINHLWSKYLPGILEEGEHRAQQSFKILCLYNVRETYGCFKHLILTKSSSANVYSQERIPYVTNTMFVCIKNIYCTIVETKITS